MAYAGVVPHHLRKSKNLGDLLITELVWPLGTPSHLKYVRDLGAEDHIAVYPYSKTLFRRNHKVNCNVSLIISEPKAIQGLYYRLLRLIRRNYNAVFLRDKALAKRYKNVHALPLARSFINLEHLSVIDQSYNKKAGTSLIASNKKQTTGHKLRHKIVDLVKKSNLKLSVLGRGYQPFNNKEDGLLPYKYSIVIENAIEPHYFTEKIIDCLLCKTIPIYWGSGDIDEYFDTTNWLKFNSSTDILEQIELTQSGLHKIDTDKLELNYQQALALTDPDKLVAHRLLELV